MTHFELISKPQMADPGTALGLAVVVVQATKRTQADERLDAQPFDPKKLRSTETSRPNKY